MPLNRRVLLKISGLAPFFASTHLPSALVSSALAANETRVFHHAAALLGATPKYPADFKNFEYVNPQAPKGGKLRLGVSGSFDSLNPYTYKGNSANIIYPAYIPFNEKLMTPSLDEASTQYGLIAESLWIPDDLSQVVFRLRPEARFHDGQAISVADVIWSYQALKENNPQYGVYFKNVQRAEQTGDHEVTFIFDQKHNRELPSIIGQLPILPKHWWTGKDDAGVLRDISKTTLEIPLGSGPYKGVAAKAGVSTLVKRMPDYWGKYLAVNQGQHNFDEIETLYFRDITVAFEAFKGDQFDFKHESSSKNWATGYNFPAVKKDYVIRQEIGLKNPWPMQAFVPNLRRKKFQDIRVRQALNLAFDFEWTNANLFYGLYTRLRSYFSNSVYEASGLPSPEELALLTPLREHLPEQVFTDIYINPVTKTPHDSRRNMREAARLLKDAGWVIKPVGNKSQLVNQQGEVFEIAILLSDPNSERFCLPYGQRLEILGIQVKIQTVDPSQYQRRLQNFDFDMIFHGWAQLQVPGLEQRQYWSSAAANTPSSLNYTGISSPAIDQLIEKVIMAASPAELTTACKALDRALIWGAYVVPLWYSPTYKFAYWNRFGQPAVQPDYNFSFPSAWWWDQEKAARILRG